MDVVAPVEVLLIIHTVFTQMQDEVILNPLMQLQTGTFGAKPRPAFAILSGIDNREGRA
jgi:hypothetical protein